MSGYIGTTPVPQATQHREAFTANADQTTFATAGYTVGFIDVWLNGVKLAAADVTVTNGSDIVLASAAAANDIIEYVAFVPFNAANQTFTGATVINSLNINSDGATVTGIKDEDNMASNDANKLATQQSIKAYVDSTVAATNEVVEDTTPQLGGDLASNGNDILMADNDKAIFGAGSDLQIYHDGSNSLISEAGTGGLKILSGDVYIRNPSDADMIHATSGGAVTLYHNANAKLATTSTGIDVTGTVTATTLHASSTASTSNSIRISNSEGSFEARVDAGEFYLYDVNDNRIPFLINSSGQTGLGTTDPRHILDIEASTTGAIPTNADMGASNENDNYFSFHNSSNSATFSGLSLETRTSGASKWLIANEWKDTYLGDLVFRVRDGGSSSSEAMRIDSSGNVGIGTSSPRRQLHLHNTASATTKFMITNGATGESNDSQGFQIGIDSSGNAVLENRENTNLTLSTNDVTRLSITNTGYISMAGAADVRLTLGSQGTEGNNDANWVRGNGTSLSYNAASANHIWEIGGAEKMRMDSSGRVGIANDTPGDFSSAADDLVIGNSSQSSGITIRSGTTANGNIFFSDGTTGNEAYRGYVQYAHNGDILRLGTAAADRIVVDGSGAVTMPYQPAFSVHKNGTDQSNFALNTDVVVTWTHSRFDQNSDFDFVNGRFTAPVTGKYQLNANILLDNIDAAADYIIVFLATSNKNYRFIFDPDLYGDKAYWSVAISVLADMDANDNVSVKVNQGGGTQQTDIDGSSDYTTFSGYLVA